MSDENMSKSITRTWHRGRTTTFIRRSSQPLLTIRILLIGATLLLPLSGTIAGCAPEGELREGEMNFLSYPSGAIAPTGLRSIKKGMGQDEVLRTLQPMYLIQHAADAQPGIPLVDYFTYIDGEQEKYVEIFYERESVLDVRFGYTTPFVME